MALGLGEIAPDFTLKPREGTDMRDVSLSSHRGKENVVLLFFPGTFTHVCTAEFCDVTDGLTRFAAENAIVYGISTDSPFSQQAWAKEVNIGFPLLSDYQREVTRAYDVEWPNFAGLGPSSARAVFVIDKEGRIRHAEQTPTLLDMPDLEKIHLVLTDL